jgi:hypothetical protein
LRLLFQTKFGQKASIFYFAGNFALVTAATGAPHPQAAFVSESFLNLERLAVLQLRSGAIADPMSR